MLTTLFWSLSRLFLLLIALSADAFAASLAYGMDRVKIPPLSAAIVALLSDFILIVSLFIGGFLQSFIPVSFTTVLSFLILLILGLIKLFDSSIKKKIKENRFSSKELRLSSKNLKFILTVYAKPQEANGDDIEVLSPAEAVSLGLALSLDSAAAGIGAASLHFPLLLTAILSFLIGMLTIFAGCRLGRTLAARSDFNFSIIGGILLILLAFSKLWG